MTSQQIQNLCVIVAENGKKLPDGSHEAVSLMHVQMLGEIAYQLARLVESQPVRVNRHAKQCPRCAFRGNLGAWRAGDRCIGCGVMVEVL